MLEPKVPAIGASIGFVLSFLTGLFSGVSISALLVRAFIMAVVFGLLTFFFRIVILRFIPELLEEQPSYSGSDEKTGNVVDITLGDNLKMDNPFGMYDGNTSGAGMVPDFLEHSESMPVDFQAERTVEDLNFVPSNKSTKERRVEPAHGNTDSIDRKVSMNGLDVLPDLQDFVPPDVVETGEDVAPEDLLSSDNGLGKSSITSDIMGSSMESDTMVKAIRTILSRDK